MAWARLIRCEWRRQLHAKAIDRDTLVMRLYEYESGGDRASGSRLPYLARIVASCTILMDAEQAGTLHDTRFKSEGFEAVMNEIVAIKAGWKRPRPHRRKTWTLNAKSGRRSADT